MTWVHERIFAAGGSHIPATWDAFADQTGISAILHLAPDRPQAFQTHPPASFLWLDLADESLAGDSERLLAGRFIQHALDQGQLVLIHSSLGRHRTRWTYVAYRLLSGRPLDKVLRQAAEPPWLAPYHTDRTAWERFHASLKEPEFRA